MNSDFILGVHALVFLNHKAETLNSETLAQNICTNPVRVRWVMARLRKAGLVETRGWRENAGYFFPLPPDTVSLRQIADALDARFVSTGWRSGAPHMKCRIASGISGVVDNILDDLNSQCLERLEHITVQDVERQLFGGSSTSVETNE